MQTLNFENYVIKYNPLTMTFNEIRSIFYEEMYKEKRWRSNFFRTFVIAFCLSILGLLFVEDLLVHNLCGLIFFISASLLIIRKPCLKEKDFSEIIKTCHFSLDSLVKKLSENEIVSIVKNHESYYFRFDGVEFNTKDRAYESKYCDISYDIDGEKGGKKTIIDLTKYTPRNVILNRIKGYKSWLSFCETDFDD